jgi:hypothetical protein
MSEVLKKYPLKFDLNQDGEVTAEEMERATTMLELELKEEKSDAQRKMAWTSIASMMIFTIILFTPILTDSRVSALADLLGLFYIGQASIVGFYFGAQAFMSKK